MSVLVLLLVLENWQAEQAKVHLVMISLDILNSFSSESVGWLNFRHQNLNWILSDCSRLSSRLKWLIMPKFALIMTIIENLSHLSQCDRLRSLTKAVWWLLLGNQLVLLSCFRSINLRCCRWKKSQGYCTSCSLMKRRWTNEYLKEHFSRYLYPVL